MLNFLSQFTQAFRTCISFFIFLLFRILVEMRRFFHNSLFVVKVDMEFNYKFLIQKYLPQFFLYYE